MVSRRSWLSGIGLLGISAIAGCLGDDETEWDGDSPDDIDALCDGLADDVWCGEASAISVSEAFDDSDTFTVNDDGSIEFQLTEGDDPQYETLEFPVWGNFTARMIAAPDPVFGFVRGSLENEQGLSSGTGGTLHPDGLSSPWFQVYEGGSAFDDPVALEEVRDVTPVYVDTTVTIADRSYRTAVPVLIGTYDDLAVDVGDPSSAFGTVRRFDY